MSRNDGRPKSVVSVGLDPLPYRHSCWDDGTCPDLGKRRATKQEPNDEFDPRTGFEQDRDKYS